MFHLLVKFNERIESAARVTELPNKMDTKLNATKERREKNGNYVRACVRLIFILGTHFQICFILSHSLAQTCLHVYGVQSVRRWTNLFFASWNCSFCFCSFDFHFHASSRCVTFWERRFHRRNVKMTPSAHISLTHTIRYLGVWCVFRLCESLFSSSACIIYCELHFKILPRKSMTEK